MNILSSVAYYVKRVNDAWIILRDLDSFVLGRFDSQEAALNDAKALAVATMPSRVFVEKAIHTFEIESVYPGSAHGPDSRSTPSTK